MKKRKSEREVNIKVNSEVSGFVQLSGWKL